MQHRLFSIESLSTRFVVGLVFVLLGIIALLQSLYAGSIYRDHAMTAEAKTLQKVIAVATEGVLEEVRQLSQELAYHLASKPALAAGLPQDASTVAESILDALDTPFHSGFPNNDRLNLEKTRLYRLDGRLVASSRQGLAELPKEMPESLAEQLLTRTGIQRLQALSGLWKSNQGTLYSLIVPVGGLRLSGYLEVVVNPRFNLPKIEDLTHLPVQVSEAVADTNWSGPNWRYLSPGLIGIDHVLIADNGQPALTLTTQLSVEAFERTVLQASIFLFLTQLLITGLALVGGYTLMLRFLIRPVQAMCDDIQHGIDTKQQTPVQTRGLNEFHTLASLFNRLMKDIHHNRSILETLSLTDELTGLANRRAFNAMMEREWHRCCRHGEAISLLLIDIDYFKKYNDSAGHQAGDAVLRQVGRLLDQQVKRSEDLAARYGGEEFAVVLPKVDKDAATNMAECIQQAVRTARIPHPDSDVSECITLSIGIASCIPNDPGRHDCFIECADKALYLAKSGGRNQSVFMQKSSMHHCVEQCALSQPDWAERTRTA